MPPILKPIASLQSLAPNLPKNIISSPASPAYWSEGGAVYQVASGGSGASILVGFRDLASFAAFCARGTGWTAVPGSFYSRTPFSLQDFPTAQYTTLNPMSLRLYQVFASQYAAPFALSFLNAIGITESGAGRATAAYTLISWSQASALPVQSADGAQTVSLTYLTLSQSKVAKYGTEIMWLGPQS